MRYTLIECGIKCPKCDNPVPLNGPWETVHCDHCQADILIPHDYWTDIFADILEEINKGELEAGEGRSSTIWGTFNTTLMYGNQIPYCLDCGTDFTADALTPDAGTLKCTECGETSVVSPSPEWLREEYPQVKLFVNTALLSSDDPNPEGVSGPIVFTCPQCGSALKVDGEDRLVPCEYCNVKVYLPDGLWLRLHPAKSKTRWFVVFEG
ncbi:hypothetical protein KAU45_03810 [bacterium]|nr:hypothetical protein [bacterium]